MFGSVILEDPLDLIHSRDPEEVEHKKDDGVTTGYQMKPATGYWNIVTADCLDEENNEMGNPFE